jgi:hypothetical protein
VHLVGCGLEFLCVRSQRTKVEREQCGVSVDIKLLDRCNDNINCKLIRGSA